MVACQIHDVHDAEAFVWKIVRRHMRMVPAEQLEDVVADGLLLLCSLAKQYDATKDTGNNASFAGYATYLMPMKMKQRWYASQPEWQKSTTNGKVVYTRLKRAVSFEEIMSYDETIRSYTDESKVRVVGNFVAVPVIERGDEDE